MSYKKKEIKPGTKFNRLTVIKEIDPYISPKGKKLRKFLCECECKDKNKVEVLLRSLESGHTKSCGCLLSETAKGKIKNLTESNKKTNKYILDKENNRYIGLTSKGKEFYFDIEDYDMVSKYYWSIDPSTGYVRAWDSKAKKQIKLHRFIMNTNNSNEKIDHKNRAKNDNTRNNLRFCSQAENTRNISKKKNNKSGFTGVLWKKDRGRWVAHITYNSKRIYLGSFKTKEEAAQARLEAEKKYFGEFSPNIDKFENE